MRRKYYKMDVVLERLAEKTNQRWWPRNIHTYLDILPTKESKELMNGIIARAEAPNATTDDIKSYTTDFLAKPSLRKYVETYDVKLAESYARALKRT